MLYCDVSDNLIFLINTRVNKKEKSIAKEY